MGLYNQKFLKLPSPLDKNICPICNHEMNPVDFEPSRDAFQYRCNNCNPNTVISISGSLLGSKYYEEIINSQHVRDYLQNEVRHCTENIYPILTTTFKHLVPATY